VLAPIVNGRVNSCWKWRDLQLSRACDLDLGSGHTAYRRASLIDLYVYAKFHWNRRNFLWTDVTYVRTDGHLTPTLSGRLRRVDLKTIHLIFGHNYSKYWPISIILSLTYSQDNFVHAHYQDSPPHLRYVSALPSETWLLEHYNCCRFQWHIVCETSEFILQDIWPL